jgi:hypothetical protein
MGTIETTCAVVASLLRGHVYDRRSLARDFDVTPATADRYLRNLLDVPGVGSKRAGRMLVVSFSFGDALRAIGK